ncbi:LexA family transcriptional regulator [Arcobacter sp. CECT 8985]|uniref:LexA family protein n=1 Tax=Arcobacter sp. CECT 8985 TaxID=1935424 RepID=UPI00100AE961|nr:XRE family transcriptional regulator [Arcobacter sp. CECT 8985]RXJ86929.1 hypothetical protein CRU93_05990 [Arcobacter sp. CECT 8985]
MIGKKISELKDEKKVSVQQIADYLGTSRSSVSGWINEPEKRSPNPEQIYMLSKFFNVSGDYLISESSLIKNRIIPLIGKSSCGVPKDYDLNGYDPIPVPVDMFKTGMYAVEADGNSMQPKINDGDIVYCCPNRIIDSGKIVHYNLNGESGIKRYKINEAGTIISLIPLNTEEYDVITIHCDDPVELKMALVVGKIDKDF